MGYGLLVMVPLGVTRNRVTFIIFLSYSAKPIKP